MKEYLTAVFEKSPHGYIGYVEELPGVNTQGKTIEETKTNLVEAIRLVLQTNRQLTEEDIISTNTEVIKDAVGNVSIYHP